MTLRICIVVTFLACIAAGIGWYNARGDLQAENKQHASSLEEMNLLVEIANGQVLLTDQKIEQANVTIGKLQQDLAESEKSVTYWWERAHTKEFGSLGELKAWLEEDDTDTTLYIFGTGCLGKYDCDDYAMALMYNALLDGYSVSLQVSGDHMLNSAVIGNEIYFIEPQTDEVWLWGYRD